MPERKVSAARYASPLEKVTPLDKNGFIRIETFQGTVADVLVAVRTGIHKIEERIQTDEDRVALFYRTYELIKMSVEEKIYADETKKEYINDALKAVEFSVDLAIACDLEDKTCRKKFDNFEKLLETPGVNRMLRKPLSEAPDPDIMPDHPAKADLLIAETIAEQTKTKDILAIGIGHRGIRRALNIFLDYCSEAQSSDSLFWPVRLSSRRGDIPHLSWREVDDLAKKANDKQLVVIGPSDRISKTSRYLRRNVILPREKRKEAGSLIEVPLYLQKR
ncbi:MAG TPA: hypothetical protein VFD45_00960 [Patescibacteria group bacterium]|nr:hypothetical protein [Patescibacteria group bacterium]